jgi:hypothetical protein
MARKVTITYASPGLQPPVYITTSLSEPQWDLLEMGCSKSPSGEWEFTKTFPAVEGEYQYKFRLGPGDWWVCDESKPTVDDGFGDRNNVLVVEEEVPAKKQAAEPQESVHDGADFEAPTLPHERVSSKEDTKRDGLGDDVVQEKHAPLFPHEQHGSPPSTLAVPPETVPVNFSRQDTLSLDDDDGDCEPSHYPDAPTFDHEKDTQPARTPTPGADEGEEDDDMDQPPLMRHETLSSEDGKSSHDVHGEEKHSNFTASPTSFHSSRLWEAKTSHVPAEADPNDPSLVKLDVLSSTSPIAKSISHSSQSPSLPSVLEEEEELEEEEDEENAGKSGTHVLPEAVVAKVHDLTTGLKSLSNSSGRPADLMTPPRTPDETEHQHKFAAQSNGQEEATLESKDSERKARSMKSDGDAGPSQSTTAENPEKHTVKRASKEAEGKAPRSGAFETVLGLGLFVAVGVGAAWLAFMMQDPIKDGGAALTGAS